MRRSTSLLTVLSATLILASTAYSQRPRIVRPVSAKATKISTKSSSSRTALLVLLENGGVAANFEDCLPGMKKKRLPNIPVASCGKLSFSLRPGESVTQMLARAASIIAQNRACSNPARWRMSSVTFDQWFKTSSDYLLEEVTKAIQQMQRTRSAYSRVIVLEDDRLTPDNAINTMTSYARSGYTLDIHVLTHGGNERFIGGNNAQFNDSTFFSKARRIPNLKIRSVYQMNCVSGTLMDDWMRLGAKVVNGTYGTKNNYMPQSYFHFTAKWLGGSTFYQAIMGAYQESRVYTEPVYSMAGLSSYVSDSRHQVKGDGNCRLASASTKPTPPNPIPQTTAALCAGYKAAKKTAEQACKLLVQAGRNILEVARELQRQYGCSAADIAKFLKRAGCSTRDIAKALKDQLNCNAETAARYLRQAGCSTAQVAQALKDQFNCAASTAAKHLRKIGCSTSQTMKAMKDQFGCSAKTAAKYLRQAGSSTSAIAKALKSTYNSSSKNIAKYLKQAGCSAKKIAATLKKDLSCSTKNVAKYMKSAGCSFNDIAKGIWAYGSKSSSAFNSLCNAMMDAYNQNMAQVMGSLAKLGISG